ncbi:hypothetical protein H0H93_007129, partial [Arthromyces matolae]
MVDKIGRRVLFITSCIGMTIMWTFQTALYGHFQTSQNAPSAHAVIAFIFLYYAAY